MVTPYYDGALGQKCKNPKLLVKKNNAGYYPDFIQSLPSLSKDLRIGPCG